jgi:hypothetical protein
MFPLFNLNIFGVSIFPFWIRWLYKIFKVKVQDSSLIQAKIKSIEHFTAQTKKLKEIVEN